MGTQYRNIVRSRKLAERSYLYFKYPSKKGESIEFYLPFMENIEVSESQRPNYATYDLIGRSSSMFAYLGSKSREMNLKFNITLPNIVDYIQNVGLSEMFADNFRNIVMDRSNSSKEREMFFKTPENGGMNAYSNTSIQSKFDYYGEGKKDIYQLDPTYVDGSDPRSGVRNGFDAVAKFFDWSNKGGFFGLLPAPEQKKGFPDIDMGKAVNYLMMWINVIRTSVINNSTKTQYGPPTVYLNHGTMYNNIPCVCTGFSVRLSSNAGYELLSLAPRQVEVTMNLSENRVGNFGDFIPFTEIEGDNLVGWEAVMTGDGTMDPNNQFLRLYRHDTEKLQKAEAEAERKARIDAALQTALAGASLPPPPLPGTPFAGPPPPQIYGPPAPTKASGPEPTLVGPPSPFLGPGF